MPQESTTPQGRRLGRIIWGRLRAAFQFILSERFARVLIATVDLAIAAYQAAIVA